MPVANNSGRFCAMARFIHKRLVFGLVVALMAPLTSQALPEDTEPDFLSSDPVVLAAMCDEGESHACTWLGNRYENGIGVERSLPEPLLLSLHRNAVLGGHVAEWGEGSDVVGIGEEPGRDACPHQIVEQLFAHFGRD